MFCYGKLISDIKNTENWSKQWDKNRSDSIIKGKIKSDFVRSTTYYVLRTTYYVLRTTYYVLLLFKIDAPEIYFKCLSLPKDYYHSC